MTPAAHNAKAGLAAVVLAGVAGMSMSGCAPKPSVDDGKSGGNEITVAASDDSCKLSKTAADPGPSTFVITNNGTAVTEFYVYGNGDRVLGEVENISPGLQRKVTVQLPEPGGYFTACKPGMIGDGIRADFTVNGDAVQVDDQARYQEAADSYKRYVTNQTTNLVTATTAFVGAVKKGDVTGAEALYPNARTYYERIKPVAESFPNDLDQRINLRENDLHPGDRWTGFHRLESDLWVSGLQPDTNAIADQLLADVKELDAGVQDPQWTIDANRITGGAQSLLDEMVKSTLTGDEDVFSHTDLWDFQANVDGARTAVGSVRPIVDQRNPDLGKQVDQAFAAAQGLLDKHHWQQGFVPYDKVPDPERQEISHAIEALGAVVNQVQGVIAQP